ncbi:MAG: hypothetical protein ACT4R6_10795 [Gemmatimonadaceae bacterium]
MQHTYEWRCSLQWLGLALLLGCAGDDSSPLEPGMDAPPAAGGDTVRIAITDMGSRTYKGFRGGLYPAGNELTGAHLSAGLTRASRIRPLDANGQPSPTGRIVLLSIGMSNTTQEFCSGTVTNCAAWSFVGQAAADPEVNRTTLAIVDGARGGQAADAWDAASEANYDMIRDQRLAARGLTERQVQVVWMKVAHRQPSSALPNADADAHLLARRMADIARAVKARYPNVQQVFASSRIFAGYATTALNPEPYAYESGFAVKWLVEAQMSQVAAGAPTAGDYGDLSYERAAPWLAWGAYLWAAGSLTRSDGLSWLASDYQSDGTHPAQSGQQKVGRLLLQFFKGSPVTRCWFLAAGAGC